MYNFGEVNYYEGDLDLKDLAPQLHSIDESLYICDLEAVVRKHQLWLKQMPNITPYYAIKCNDDPFIADTLLKLNVNFDCASMNEIRQVLKQGGSDCANRIIFANPSKPASHLAYAKEHGIRMLTVDNEFEMYKIYKHYPEASVIVRFLCEAKSAQCLLGDKFGCNAETDAAALILLAKSLKLNVVGTSFHVGSGCNDLLAYKRAIAIAKNITTYGKVLGYDMEIVDIGGGFPGNDDEKFIAISDIVREALQKHFPDNAVKVIAEPGRFYVAAAYTLLCKIHAKREVRVGGKLQQKMYFVNDGVYGSFNCILYDYHHAVPQLLQHNVDSDVLPTHNTLIWGPTCDALDKIAENLSLPNLCCDDVIAFPNMGAYTVPVASPFNGFALPKTLYFLKSRL